MPIVKPAINPKMDLTSAANVGDPEDSAQSCLKLLPKAPKKDLKKFIALSGKVFTFIIVIYLTGYFRH